METFAQWFEKHDTVDLLIESNTIESIQDYISKFTEHLPKVLWITGMNSSGAGPNYLKKLGYIVKHITTTTNWPAAISGRISRYPVLKQTMKRMADRMNKTHVAVNVAKHNEEIGDFDPDIVVGTSQGGAIAIALAGKYHHAKFVLGAPAWKIFNVNPANLPPDTIIVHGVKDGRVPFKDSIELAAMTGASLIKTGANHFLDNTDLLKAVMKQVLRIGKRIPTTVGAPEMQPQHEPVGA